MRQQTDGFTIIEVLVTIMLLSIIILIAIGSFNGLFSLSRKSSQQVDASSRTQAVIEEFKGQWLDQVAYDRACLKNDTNVANVTISIQDEDAAGNAIGSPYTQTTAADCTDIATIKAAGAAQPAAPLRAVTVSSTSTSGSASVSRLTLEISRP